MLDNNQIGCRPCLFMQEDDDSIVKNILSLYCTQRYNNV